jgi:hypothetical protein
MATRKNTVGSLAAAGRLNNDSRPALEEAATKRKHFLEKSAREATLEEDPEKP